MNIWLKSIRCLAGSVATLLFICMPSSAMANALDNLRNVIDGEKYTIEYVVDHGDLGVKRDMQHGTLDKGKIQIDDGMSPFGPMKYIVVCDGQNVYTEIGTGSKQVKCYLKQGEKVFEFLKLSLDGKKITYTPFPPVGNKIAARRAVSADQKERYGVQDLETALRALYPDREKRQYESVYREANSGTTEDGLQFFDLKSEKSTDKYLNVIRYYFDGDNLVRISHATTSEGNVYKTMIKVTRFSSVPDQTYLTLPKELKVVE